MKKSVAGDFRMMLPNQIKEPLIRRRKDHGKTLGLSQLLLECNIPEIIMLMIPNAGIIKM